MKLGWAAIITFVVALLVMLVRRRGDCIGESHDKEGITLHYGPSRPLNWTSRLVLWLLLSGVAVAIYWRLSTS